MLRKLTIVLSIILLLSACGGNDKQKKPENLIPKEKMASLLYDLYVINAAKGVNRKSLEVIGFQPDEYILNKYNVDSTQFAESNTYYAFNSKSYTEIIEDVKTRLEEEKAAYDEQLKKENEQAKKRRDSLKTAQKKRIDSIKTASKQTLKTN